MTIVEPRTQICWYPYCNISSRYDEARIPFTALMMSPVDGPVALCH